jgi:tight adherence protein C
VPEVLDVLRATIAAGVAPRRALQAAAEAAPASLAGVLAGAVRSTELGSGAGRALADAGRMGRLGELVLAGEALDLAEATGAPAGRVLAGVTAAATDRVRSRQARLAATAEARLSARVVAGMAPGFLLIFALTAPADAAFLIRGPAGWATLAVATFFEALGAWWAGRIVTGGAVAAHARGEASLPGPAEPSTPTVESRLAGPTGRHRPRHANAAGGMPGAVAPSLQGRPRPGRSSGAAGQLISARRRRLSPASARPIRRGSGRVRQRNSTSGVMIAGVLALAVGPLAFLAGPLPALAAALVVACALLAVRVARRRDGARRRAELADAAPAVIDLLGACLLAGLNPYLALKRVAERSPQALRAELAAVAVDLELGRPPGTALGAAADRTGLDELRAAASVLSAAERWGTPPAEALAARAESLRSRARQQAEADAGRAAVRLAFPLVFCFLPAFVALVVVPTLAGALRALAP